VFIAPTVETTGHVANGGVTSIEESEPAEVIHPVAKTLSNSDGRTDHNAVLWVAVLGSGLLLLGGATVLYFALLKKP
jgi:hypothetical protein